MMEPYYTDDAVTLYHGDCLEIDAWLAADVLVTDPPYGMSYVSGYRDPTRLAAVAGDTSPVTRDEALLTWNEADPPTVARRARLRGQRMTEHDTKIVDVRNASGYSIGWSGRCETHDWWGDPRERPTRALMDIDHHLSETRNEN